MPKPIENRIYPKNNPNSIMCVFLNLYFTKINSEMIIPPNKTKNIKKTGNSIQLNMKCVGY